LMADSLARRALHSLLFCSEHGLTCH
jgi:hypothetical protein